MEDALNSTVRHFGRIFHRQMIWAESLDEVLAAGVQ
jgi:hypothetical protein